MSADKPLSDEEVLTILGYDAGATNFVPEVVTPELRQFADDIRAKVSTLNLEGAMDAIDTLITFVQEMTIAEHFRAVHNEDSPWRCNTITNPLLGGLSEAELKRAQLVRNLESMKADIGSLIVRARMLAADILITQNGLTQDNVVSSPSNEEQ